ncbi:UNKNOWN [Stylonychia lemnae]|uniref:Uncharacterized protein n=1 Tax=Stylonychia lemnae TaxID=5949 RepID=A0A078ABD0_STYLE|nr:UNKNOWN [Stylonychia lemnae]|eukprot:CDW78872.1 UNKNOWN [Stylonychia lemnae]
MSAPHTFLLLITGMIKSQVSINAVRCQCFNYKIPCNPRCCVNVSQNIFSFLFTLFICPSTRYGKGKQGSVVWQKQGNVQDFIPSVALEHFYQHFAIDYPLQTQLSFYNKFDHLVAYQEA